jgi:hypothetical protein
MLYITVAAEPSGETTVLVKVFCRRRDARCQQHTCCCCGVLYEFHWLLSRLEVMNTDCGFDVQVKTRRHAFRTGGGQEWLLLALQTVTRVPPGAVK